MACRREQEILLSSTKASAGSSTSLLRNGQTDSHPSWSCGSGRGMSAFSEYHHPAEGRTWALACQPDCAASSGDTPSIPKTRKCLLLRVTTVTSWAFAMPAMVWHRPFRDRVPQQRPWLQSDRPRPRPFRCGAAPDGHFVPVYRRMTAIGMRRVAAL